MDPLIVDMDVRHIPSNAVTHTRESSMLRSLGHLRQLVCQLGEENKLARAGNTSGGDGAQVDLNDLEIDRIASCSTTRLRVKKCNSAGTDTIELQLSKESLPATRAAWDRHSGA